MTDLDKAITAAREALSEYDAYGMPIDAGSIRDLLAALDAARGQAVAYALPKALAETRADGFTVVRAGHQHHTDGTYCVPVYLAPPAAVFKSTAKRVAALQARDAAQAPPAAAVPADQEPLCVGPGNYYGSLEIRCKDGLPEWCVENYSGHHWERCPLPVYVALLAAKENTNG